MSERVILAYSGGLDTSVAISWIGKETGREVVAVAIDLGQGGEDMEVVRQRALDCGAVEAVVVDARDEFAAIVEDGRVGGGLAVEKGDREIAQPDGFDLRRDPPAVGVAVVPVMKQPRQCPLYGTNFANVVVVVS